MKNSSQSTRYKSWAIFILCFLSLIIFTFLNAQETSLVTLARLKYQGGGDWYNDPDALPNLAKELNRKTNIATYENEIVTTLLDDKLYNYPFLYITGHGNISFNEQEVTRLRNYLVNGGFLYADDDYGMDESFRREMKKVFPNQELVELPFDHLIYHPGRKTSKVDFQDQHPGYTTNLFPLRWHIRQHTAGLRCRR